MTKQTDEHKRALYLADHALKLRDKGKLDAALALVSKAFRTYSHDPVIRVALGAVELAIGLIDKAGEDIAIGYDAAIKEGMTLDKLAEIEHMLALVHCINGDFAIGMRLFKKAAAVGNRNSTWDLAVTNLLLGAWEEGFKGNEYRLPFYGQKRLVDVPMWKGEQTDVLWISCEQGAGDIFMLSRYLLWAATKCKKLIFSVYAGLMPLFADYPGVSELRLNNATTPPPLDATAFCFMASLPFYHGTTLDNIPEDLRWFQAIAKLPNVEMKAPAGNLKVGLVWAGSPTHARDRDRSISLDELLCLTGYPNVSVFSFQIGERHKDIAALEAQDLLIDCSQNLSEWLFTAAALCELDVLVTVDTAVAHLAGLLGVPTMILISKLPDWRWLLDREDSVWYKSVKLYRQTENNSWQEPIERVCQDIQDMALSKDLSNVASSRS